MGGRDAGACSSESGRRQPQPVGARPNPDPDWNNYSDLSFHSLDIEDSGFFNLPQDLEEGQPSFMTTEAEYVSNYGNVPRFDPAQGDSAWVVQSQQRDAGWSRAVERPWPTRSWCERPT